MDGVRGKVVSALAVRRVHAVLPAKPVVPGGSTFPLPCSQGPSVVAPNDGELEAKGHEIESPVDTSSPLPVLLRHLHTVLSRGPRSRLRFRLCSCRVC